MNADTDWMFVDDGGVVEYHAFLPLMELIIGSRNQLIVCNFNIVKRLLVNWYAISIVSKERL
jgi:hypothetical protein